MAAIHRGRLRRPTAADGRFPADAPLTVLVYVAEFEYFTGSQRSLLHALVHLRSPARRFVVALPAEGGCARAFREAGFEVVVIPAPPPMLLFGGAFDRQTRWGRLWITVRHALPYWLRVRSLVRRRGVRLVHCNSHRSVLFAGVGARLAGRPVIWHIRGRLHPNRALRALAELLASRVVVVSSALLDEVSPRARAKATVIPNAVDETCLEPRPPREADGRFRVGALAALVPYKGIHHLLRATARLEPAQLRAPVELLIAGDSRDARYRRYLEGLVDGLGLRGVRFLGYLEDPQSLYHQLDLVVVSSVERELLRYPDGEVVVRGTEGLPRTILEAMYLGKPVVATDVAGVRDQVIDGETGLLVPPGDDRALAAAIARVVNDDELRSRLVENAARHVRRAFSTETMVARLEDLYAALTA